MKIIVAILLFSHSILSLANNDIWLQDIDCKMIGSNGLEVKPTAGSLITYICNKNGNVVTCSNTAKNEKMYGSKPSVINTYTELIIDENYIVWKASSYEGMIILDIKNKRYSATSTYILPGWLVNKNCAGEIKSY